MNIKEIASLTGKAESTIRSWVSSAKTAGASAIIAQVSDKMAEAKKTQKPADFTLEETIAIIRAGGNDTLANLLMQNAKTQKAEVVTLNSRDMDMISAVVEKTVTAIMSSLQRKEGAVQAEKPVTGQAQIPAPIISTRSEINRLVRNYADRIGIEFHIAWGQMYSDLKYAYHIDVKTAARNRKVSAIEYVESIGKMDELMAVVKERCL